MPFHQIVVFNVVSFKFILVGTCQCIATIGLRAIAVLITTEMSCHSPDLIFSFVLSHWSHYRSANADRYSHRCSHIPNERESYADMYTTHPTRDIDRFIKDTQRLISENSIEQSIQTNSKNKTAIHAHP